MDAFKIKYPVMVHPEPGYQHVFCILDAEQRLVAAMMHWQHATEIVETMNRTEEKQLKSQPPCPT